MAWINLEKTLEILLKNLESHIGRNRQFYKGFREAYRLVENMSKSDVAPVVHGKWDVTETVLGTCCVCSVCGSCPTMDYKYCPYCGAKMDLE